MRSIGLVLSLLCFRYPGLPTKFLTNGDHWKPNSAVIEHRSVHDGRSIRSIPLAQAVQDVDPEEWKDFEDERRWWRLTWEDSVTGWDKAEVS